ncbi:MAG: hypothetical protein ACFFE4_11340 [Candidatus Thorarchaeota archaeon]
MKYQLIIFKILVILLCLNSFAISFYGLKPSPTFQLGDSCVPMDEEGFIEYDFNSSVAASLAKIKMEIVDIYQIATNPPLLVVNLSVSKLNPDNNDYEALIVDSIEFANQTCLLYNKSEQYFRYHQNMENLLTNGYGGFYLIPNDPVNISLITEYIETYTSWAAGIVENEITIDVNNDQVTLHYNNQGILVREEIKSAGQIVSTLSISMSYEPTIAFGGGFSLILTMAAVGLLIIVSIRKKTHA